MPTPFFYHLTKSMLDSLALSPRLIETLGQDQYITLYRLSLGALMGGLLGWERGRSEKPAGIRTMLLIGAGAAAFALIGQRTIDAQTHSEIIRADPTRVLSYIISGVGFLGAGAILHSKRSIKGLTTAASIWVTAGVGAACGLGQYSIGFLLFSIAFIALWSPWIQALFLGELYQYEHPDEEKDPTKSP